MLEKLNVGSFEPLIGQKFEVSAGDQTYVFELVEVEKLQTSGRRRRSAPAPAREPFSIFFIGEPLLPQATYPMKHAAFGDSPLPIFIVPLGPAEGGYEYEAVFT